MAQPDGTPAVGAAAGAPVLTESSQESAELMHVPQQPVESSQQFFAWFAQVEGRVEYEQEQAFRAYQALLRGYSSQCDALLSEMERALKFLSDLELQHKTVATKTSTLHEECEQLVREQTSLISLMEAISNRLSYFEELDRLSSKLHAPTPTMLNEQFVPILARLDDCIAYMADHRHYKEAPRYLTRFRQCQGRALALVKGHITGTLRTATQNVQTQIQGSDAEASFTLLYGKFRLYAPRVKMLMDEIEQRAVTMPDYKTLLLVRLQALEAREYAEEE